jgi:hypothetical protein
MINTAQTDQDLWIIPLIIVLWCRWCAFFKMGADKGVACDKQSAVVGVESTKVSFLDQSGRVGWEDEGGRLKERGCYRLPVVGRTMAVNRENPD